MLVKPVGPYSTLEGRIDGVAYGDTRYGVTANWWYYPLSSPSYVFETSNAGIRALDNRWYTLTGDIWEDWEAWIEQQIRGQICLLWDAYKKARDIADAGKAGYVNCNQWRSNLNQPYSDLPPVIDIYPNGDSLELVSGSPMVVKWNRPGPPPSEPMFMAVWGVSRNNAGTAPVAIQKMRWLANIPMVVDTPIDLQAVIDTRLPKWSGAYVNLGVAAGMVGSVPFSGFQVGAYQ